MVFGRELHIVKRRGARAMLLAAVLSVFCALLSGGCLAAEYPDIQGHWAYAELSSAIERGYIQGFEDGSIRPDEPVTGAQAAALICRMLEAGEGEAVSGVDQALWYAPDAGKAYRLGMISSAQGLDSPLPRRAAFVMAAEAFQLCLPGEDTSCLDGFSDGRRLSAEEQRYTAALVNLGCVQGNDGHLSIDAPFTRAQFAALLCRLTALGEISTTGEIADWSGGVLWLSCSAGNARLTNVTADRVIIRSQSLSEVRLTGCHIGRLILAGEGDASVYPAGAEALDVGRGKGSVALRGDVNTLELCGGRSVAVYSAVGSAGLYGDGCALTISEAGSCSEVAVLGRNGSVDIRGRAGKISVYGADAALSGYMDEVYVRAPGCKTSGYVRKLTDETDYGVTGVGITLSHPETLPAGETLSVTAELSHAPAGLSCGAEWYVDGEQVSTETVALTGEDTLTLEYDYLYVRGMPLESEIELRLRYVTNYGEEQVVSEKCVQTLENYPDDHVFPTDPDRILALVTTEYKGDHTLEWALQNDYEPYEKTAWVNLQGYESETQYLIWINQSCQRVNVFEGQAGNWTLIRECVVGCGANGTPRGVCKTTYKQEGWFTSGYDVKPVVRFLGGGYAFHSRLYYPGTDELLDASIGYPISHGCIRMYDEDIQWLYINVPNGTTVVVF